MGLSMEIPNDIGLQLIPRTVGNQRHFPTGRKGRSLETLQDKVI